MSEKNIIIELVCVAVGGCLTILVAVIITKMIRKRILSILKPDPIQLQKANELLDANNDKIELMNTVLNNYKKYNLTELRIKSPVYIPALFNIMDEFLLCGDKINSKENITKIKALINCKMEDIIQCRIAGLFFISLLLNTDFNFKKYYYAVAKAHQFHETKNMKKIDADIYITSLNVIAKDEQSKIFKKTSI
ncbi:hypothetical protein GVAV_000520 [Gurleya vavrai]